MLLLSALLLASPSDSALALQKCGTPREPIGIIFSAGTVTFGLSAKGAVDSGSIRVIHVDRGTPEGLRSVLVRQLPACRFKVQGSHAASVAEVRVAFDSDKMRLFDLAWAAPGDTTALPPEPFEVAPGEVVGFTDDSLEERPANNCQVLVPRDAVTTRDRMAAGQPDIPVTSGPTSGGVVLMRYVVSPKGRVNEDTIQIEQTSGPTQTRNAMRLVTACHWIPGRIHGQPVAVQIAQRQKF